MRGLFYPHRSGFIEQQQTLRRGNSSNFDISEGATNFDQQHRSDGVSSRISNPGNGLRGVGVQWVKPSARTIPRRPMRIQKKLSNV